MYIQQCCGCCWAISPGIYPLDDGEFIHNGQLTSEASDCKDQRDSSSGIH